MGNGQFTHHGGIMLGESLPHCGADARTDHHFKRLNAGRRALYGYEPIYEYQ